MQYPELVGQVDENGYPVLEGVGGFWWIFGTQANGSDGYLTGINDETGVVYKNRRMWEALRNGETFTLNKMDRFNVLNRDIMQWMICMVLLFS